MPVETAGSEEGAEGGKRSDEERGADQKPLKERPSPKGLGPL